VRTARSVFILMVVAFTSVLSNAGHSSQPISGAGEMPDSSWNGHFSQQSQLCTYPSDGARCSEQFRDHLKITKSGNRRYQVDLSSTQADQHVCSFSFLMEIVNNELIYRSDFGPVRLLRKEDALEISSSGVDPTAFGLSICGAHADINGLRFLTANKCDAECKQ
jgi:hypothetical protein